MEAFLDGRFFVLLGDICGGGGVKAGVAKGEVRIPWGGTATGGGPAAGLGRGAPFLESGLAADYSIEWKT
jgi:hypothetical protein